MRVLDLFSGIGGFSLGLERAGMQTVAFCEINPFRRKILAKHWPNTPIYNDIRSLSYARLKKDGIDTIDVICGGFPCQPFSVAGRKRGTKDDRDLWPEMCRIIKECQPTWVIGENVANFTNMAFTRTKIDLEGAGYEVQPLVIPACAIGAPHRRDRVWIIAHLKGAASRHENIKCFGVQKQVQFRGNTSQRPFKSWWECEPRVGRVVHGIPPEMDRIRALGDTVVPQIPEIIGGVIIKVD